MKTLLFLFFLLFSFESYSLDDGVWVPLDFVKAKKISSDQINYPINALLIRDGKIYIESIKTDYLPVKHRKIDNFYELTNLTFNPTLKKIYSDIARLYVNGNESMVLSLSTYKGDEKNIQLVHGINKNIKFSINFRNELALLEISGTYDLYALSGLLIEKGIKLNIDGNILNSDIWTSFNLEMSGVQLSNQQGLQYVYYNKIIIHGKNGESEPYIALFVDDKIMNIYSYKDPTKTGYGLEPIELKYYLRKK